MNIDDHPAIAGQLGIQSIPAVIAFKNGQPVDGFMGAVPESQIREFIDKLVGKDGGQPQIAEALAAAKQARGRGRSADRRRHLRRRAAARRRTMSTRSAGWPTCCSRPATRPAPRSVLARAPADKKDAPAHCRRCAPRSRSPRRLQASAIRPSSSGGWPQNPKDHQARFDLAMIQNAQGKREEAADNLLAIVKADRDLERRRRAGAAAEVLRGLGHDRRGDAGDTAQTVVAAVFVTAAGQIAFAAGLAIVARCARLHVDAVSGQSEEKVQAGNRNYRLERGSADDDPGVSPCRPRCFCLAAACRSTYSSRAICR